MNIQKFTGATAREALGKARMAFGEHTLILSNRQTAEGVEVMATAEENITEMDQRAGGEATAGNATSSTARPAAPSTAAAPAQAAPIPRPRAAAPSPAPAPARTAATPATHQPVEEDTAQLAMSTLSFQDYVRERMLRKRATEAPARSFETHPQFMVGAGVRTTQSARAAGIQMAPQAPQAPQATHTPKMPARHAAPAAAAAHREPVVGARSIVDEMQAMRAMFEDRFNTFAWFGETKQHPIQSNLMLKLIRSGYSPALARAILEHMPPELAAPDAIQWMMDAIERNLHVHQVPLQDEGGIFALVGATGVGKTTTVAKLAGQCARAYGAAAVGMVTLDTHRVGAHEQLREHGRNLGLVAHLAHDRAALQDLLGLFSNKKLVLIDTTGVSPRDPERDETLGVLDMPGIQRLLVLNAGSQGDTLDEVVGAFSTTTAQQVVLSKTDEAVKLGPVIDVAIRHQLLLRGVTCGQKVPQDWANADAGELVRSSMRSSGKASAFDPRAADLGFLFMPHDGGRATAGAAAHV